MSSSSGSRRSQVVPIVTVVVVGTLIVAGAAAVLVWRGVGGADASAPTGTPAAVGTRTPSPMPTPTLTPTPTPTEDPADPGTWLVDFSRVGPIALGEERSAVKAALPAFTDQTDPICVPGQLDLTQPDGASFVLSMGKDGRTIGTVEVAAPGPGSPPSTPRTSAGIGVGSSYDDLAAAYPELQKTGVYSEKLTSYGITDGSGTWIAFAVWNDSQNVVRMQVGPSKTLPPEHCPA